IDAMTEEQTTYQQMRENSVKCALWLKQSLSTTFIITICTRHKMLEYIPFLASLYVGIIVNTWDEKNMKDKIRVMYFLTEYKPNIIFIDNDNYRQLNSAIQNINSEKENIKPPKIITFGRIEGVDSLESILNNDFEKSKIDEFSCEHISPSNLVATMFSPNATNYVDSKVHIRYFALTYPSNQEVPVMSSGDIGLWYGSLSWSYGVILTVRSIISYVTVVKCSKFSDENMYETIEKYKVSWVFLESKMCNQMYHTDIRMYNISSLKQLVIDDSAINFIDVQKKLCKTFINVSIIQVYSIAELCIIAAYQRNNQQFGSSGYVAKNIQLMVLDMELKEPVSSNIAGTIWYKLICKYCSPQTCKLQNFNNKWCCTEDYGYYAKDGEIIIIDKIKDLIKHGIFYLAPTKIENMLLKHPAVSEVVVLSVPCSTNGQNPIAYIKTEIGVKVTAWELMKFVADNLPDIYQLRGGLHFKRSMSHLPNGKIDRMRVTSNTYIIKSIGISKNISLINNIIVHLIDAMTEEQTTYQQMWENSVKCALWFKQLRCRKNVIAICTRHKMLEYIPFLMSIYVGATVNLWNKKYMKDNIRIMYFLIEYEPDIIFIDSDNYGQLNSVIQNINREKKNINPPKIITFGRIEGVDSLESILNKDFEKKKIDKFSCVNVEPMDIIAIMFSPSATSYPNSKTFIRRFALTYPSNQEVPVMCSGDIGLWYGSLSWSYGVILTVRSIISYVTVVKCSKCSDMYETIEKYKISWVFLESKMCIQFRTNIHKYDISSIKQLVIDDSTMNFINAQVVLCSKFINASIVQVYSIAEACIIAAFQRNNRRLGSSGYAAKNIQLKLLDVYSQEIVDPCRTGTIWYKFVFKWCCPQTCKLENFSKRWHCSGDYGFYKKDGEIFVIDKVKDLIKYRKFLLSPTIIENMLLQHPVVSEVSVGSVPSTIDGHHPIAYVKKKCGLEVTARELMKFVADNLLDVYQLRGGLHFKRSMSYLPNGKIDRMRVTSSSN
ncbi:Luciferin 4-monooxygenase, partial [Trachymyrmex zeteki]